MSIVSAVIKTVSRFGWYTVEELTESANKLKSGKSPGLGGITAEMIKILVKEMLNKIIDFMNLIITKEVSRKSGWRVELSASSNAGRIWNGRQTIDRYVCCIVLENWWYS